MDTLPPSLTKQQHQFMMLIVVGCIIVAIVLFVYVRSAPDDSPVSVVTETPEELLQLPEESTSLETAEEILSHMEAHPEMWTTEQVIVTYRDPSLSAQGTTTILGVPDESVISKGGEIGEIIMLPQIP